MATVKEMEKVYNDYVTKHINTVNRVLQDLINLDIPYIKDNEDRLVKSVAEHDKSKWNEPEYSAYRKHFDPVDDKEGLNSDEYEKAWTHHYCNNPHHWEYWCDINDNGEFTIKEDIDEEDYKYNCVERICDWTAMSRQFGNRLIDWYNSNKDSMVLYEPCVPFMEELIDIVTKNNLDISEEDYMEDEALKESMGVSIDNLSFTEEDVERVKRLTKENMAKHPYAKFIGFLPTSLVDECKEYDRTETSPKRQEDFEELFNEIKENGLTDSGFLEYDPYNCYVNLGEGNHRLLIFKTLGIEEFPVYCVRCRDLTYGYKISADNITPYDFGAFGEEIYATPMHPKYLGEPFGENYDGKTILQIENEKVITPDRNNSVNEEIITGGVSRDYVKKLGKRVKKSKTSNTIEIDTQMTNHDKQLDEDFGGNSGYVGQSKSVRAYEAEDDERYPASECDKLLGVRAGATASILVPSEYHHTGSYYNETDYYDIRLLLAVKEGNDEVLDDYSDEEIQEAKEKLEELKAWRKPELKSEKYKATVEWLTWSGSRQHPRPTEHIVTDVEVEERGCFYYFPDEYGNMTKKKIGSNGTHVRKNIKEGTRQSNKDVLINFIKDSSTDELKKIASKLKGKFTGRKLRDNLIKYIKNQYSSADKKTKKEIETIICNVLHKDSEEYLTEMKLNQILNKSKMEDKQRVSRAKAVKTTYIGLSKFGVLNFKTTSQFRNGYHYQTIEFKDMSFFDDIIKSGREVTYEDIDKALKEQDVYIFCTDESFTYWAWGHLAYVNDFLYIDDKIPDLKKRTQAPKVNNVRLNGGSCKHILSVINYLKTPFVKRAIADDMNAYLQQQTTKTDKQDDTTRNRKDATKKWNNGDYEDYTGLTKQQILADISKTLQIVPSMSIDEIIYDIVGEALPDEEQGLKREIVSAIKDDIKGAKK